MRPNSTFTHRLLSASLIFALLLSLTMSYGQSNSLDLERKKTEIQKDPKVHSVRMAPLRSTPSQILFDTQAKEAYTPREIRQILNRHLNLRQGKEEMRVLKRTEHLTNTAFIRYQQYFEGIKVEHGQYIALVKEDKLASLNGEYYQIDNLNTRPSISEASAIEAALNHIGAEEYVWEYIAQFQNGVNAPKIADALEAEYELHYPKGELVIVDDYSTEAIDLDLAYKFNIYANKPLSRDWVYVNAHDGRIMLTNAIIKHASVQTRYNGIKDIFTTMVPGANPSPEYAGDTDYFILLDETRGNGIQTYDMNGLGGAPISVSLLYNLATDLVDDDDIWSISEHVRDPAPTQTEVVNDDIAWDAHWGAAMVYDYWKERHNRDSYDGNNAKINSYVHYGEGYDNAFWNGSVMTYGDGSYRDLVLGYISGFSPLTSLDVCAHEIGHAVCEHTSDLVYRREAGAMNEGFSDIWAACVENYVLERYAGESFDYKPW